MLCDAKNIETAFGEHQRVTRDTMNHAFGLSRFADVVGAVHGADFLCHSVIDSPTLAEGE